ncbi:MAG: hypothetical protein P4L49_01555 [Desulfosporosinus sp.]|nr:hypothetical protein [Desulfosporosinus sp.]
MANKVNGLNDEPGLADLLGLKKNTVSSGLPPSRSNQLNPVGNALKFIGIALFVIGLIGALIIGNSDNFPNELKSTEVILILISSTIQCALFYGFSEIIFLLNGIKNKNEEG